MSHHHQHKYLVTTNAVTGEIESVEQLGSAGELIAVDPSTLLGSKVAHQAVSSHLSHVAATDITPGIFYHGPELPDVRSEEAAAPGVFLSPELPALRSEEAAAPGVFFGSPELPAIDEAAATPGVFFHGPELPDIGSATH